jgi:hypothetical protein
VIVTPGDILARCRALEARMQVATQAINAAALEQLDAPYREAWNARLRRWAGVREQCGDWSSRWWNYKWGPLLDDWTANQAEWERQIETRTGRALPVPAQVKPAEDPTLPKLPELGTGLGAGFGVGLVALAAMVALGMGRARK